MTSLKAGEINLDLIPDDWALTPIGDKKNPYLNAWQNHPCSKKEIKKELESGRAKAVGLIAGNYYNNPYHLIWIDIDGESVWPVIEQLSGTTDISISLPPTLTILSGKPGRERRLYQLPKEKAKHLQRGKYATKPVVPNEKLEILCDSRRQGVLMGYHPDTDGYFTKDLEDYRYVKDLPELPEWILKFIQLKNIQQGKPESNHQRIYSPEFAVEVKVGDQRTLYEMEQALKHMADNGHMDDYDMWITIGQAIHDFDDSLYDLWDTYSQASEKYDPQVTLDKWNSFGGGRGIGLGTLFHHAQEAGYQFNAAANEAFSSSDALLDAQSEAYTKFQAQDPMAQLLQNALNAAEDYEKDSKFTSSSSSRSKTNSPDNQLVMTIASILNGNMVFSTTHNNFMEYRSGAWSVVEKDAAEAKVEGYFYEMASTHLPKGWDNNRVISVTKSLSRYLRDDKEWNTNPHLRCFANVVIDLQTLETFPHSRNHRLTRRIPYNYNENADCQSIKQWLYDVQDNDEQIVEILRAWMRACLVGAYDIQRFLEVVGPGKTGKSTFASLCTALVGLENTVSTDFENLRNRFESSRFIDASLCVFNDVERYAGDVSKFKAMTGGDPLRAEHKNSSTKIPGFYFQGLCIVTANEFISATDNTSGLKRRRITIPFNRRFQGNAKEQVVLISNKLTKQGSVATGAFAPELPGLINWLLEMSNDDMKSLLIDTDLHSKELKMVSDAVDASTNLQQAWLMENVVFNPAGCHPIGRRQDQREPNAEMPFKKWETELYPNYITFAHSMSPGRTNAMGAQRFKDWLLDELQHVLRLNVSFFKSRNRNYIQGISLRDSWPDHQTSSTISRHKIKDQLLGSHEEAMIQINDEGSSRYAKYPTVQEAAENPAYWEEKFLEWAPSMGSCRILKD